MNSTLKGLMALGAVAAASVPAAANAQLAAMRNNQQQEQPQAPSFTMETCEVDTVRGKVNLTEVRSTNGIYPMTYSFNCNGIPVQTTFSERIPHRHIKTMSMDYRKGGLDYTYTVSTPSSQQSYARPQSTWAPAARPQQPQEDPNVAMCRRKLAGASGNGTIMVGTNGGNCVMRGGVVTFQRW